MGWKHRCMAEQCSGQLGDCDMSLRTIPQPLGSEKNIASGVHHNGPKEHDIDYALHFLSWDDLQLRG